MEKPSFRLSRKYLFLLFFVVFGALFSLTLSRIGGQNLAALAQTLKEEAGVTSLDTNELVWEPSRGSLGDLLRGRPILFLARAQASAPRDLFRAFVRVTPEGKMLSVASVYNLTATPIGDEQALVVRGHRAAYSTLAFGQIQTITLFDLTGEHEQNLAKTLAERLMSSLTNLQQFGQSLGVGKMSIHLSQPVRKLALRLEDSRLLVQTSPFPENAATATSLGDFLFSFDDSIFFMRPSDPALQKRELSSDLVQIEKHKHVPKLPIHWLVDSVRSLSFVGPKPIAWLEEHVFELRDKVRRLSKKQEELADPASESRDKKHPPVELPPSSSKPLELQKKNQNQVERGNDARDLNIWPPPSIKSIWKTPQLNEGEWQLPEQAWVRRMEGKDVPPAFYVAYVRPDPERPYVKVWLVAMDGRQIELGMEGGSEDPKPLTGPPGKGRLPRDPSIYTRVAAAFNGGFKTEHGSYGMVVDRRVLLPPVFKAATVITLKDGRFAMGSWGDSTRFGGALGVDGDDIVSLRQNMEALVDRGVLNPSGRTQWGFTLPGTSMQTERSGLCLSQEGHLFYVWGDDISAAGLGKAMNMAGCVYGMHLDMNPHHTGFIFTNIQEISTKNYRSELLSKQMEISPDRYIEYTPKDFFYIMLRRPFGAESVEPSPGGPSFLVDHEGVQPSPLFFPAVLKTQEENIEIYKIDGQRVSFSFGLGGSEASLSHSLPAKTGTSSSSWLEKSGSNNDVLFRFGLCATGEKVPLGLVVDGKILYLPSNTENTEHKTMVFRFSEGLLDSGVRAAGSFSFGNKAGFLKPSEHGVDVELFALLMASKDDETHVPKWPRGKKENQSENQEVAEVPYPDNVRVYNALGITPLHDLIVAHSESGTRAQELARSLKKAGAVDAVLLDRSALEPQRGGRPTPTFQRTKKGVVTPWASSDGCNIATLEIEGLPYRPRGFRFEAENSADRTSKQDPKKASSNVDHAHMP